MIVLTNKWFKYFKSDKLSLKIKLKSDDQQLLIFTCFKIPSTGKIGDHWNVPGVDHYISFKKIQEFLKDSIWSLIYLKKNENTFDTLK